MHLALATAAVLRAAGCADDGGPSQAQPRTDAAGGRHDAPADAGCQPVVGTPHEVVSTDAGASCLRATGEAPVHLGCLRGEATLLGIECLERSADGARFYAPAQRDLEPAPGVESRGAEPPPDPCRGARRWSGLAADRRPPPKPCRRCYVHPAC